MNHSSLIRVGALILVSVASCEKAQGDGTGSAALDVPQPIEGSAPETSMTETPDAGLLDHMAGSGQASASCEAEDGSPAEDATDSAERNVRRKSCYATCTVQNVGSGTCPDTVSGFGDGGILAGCRRVCRRAKGDAASKLPPGCQINQCNFSGC